MDAFFGLVLFPLTILFACLLNWQAKAEGQNAFERGETVHIGQVDVKLGEDANRWGATRQGNVEIGKNTFVFGREDTYESMTTRTGIDLPKTGATIGVGMGFTF